MIGKDTATEDILVGKVMSAWERRSPNGTVTEKIKLKDSKGRCYSVVLTVEGNDA